MANEMRDRLVELLLNGEKQFFDTKANRTTPLQSYLSNYLIENGVVLPPCYIGQRVWKKFKWFNGNVEIQEGKVSMLQQKADKSWKIRVSIGSSVQDFKVEDIGKTVFLTKAEAEQKLKEMRGDTNA